MKFFHKTFHCIHLFFSSIGAVYAADTPLGTPVAIKVININGLPQASLRIVKVYLNEVAMLERLRQESRHVVYIYDFDFDSHTGLGKGQNNE